MRTNEELPGRSPIATGQARLTFQFLRDGLPEKKLQLVGTSILLILLSPEPGCYNYPEALKTEQLEEALEYISRMHRTDVELQAMDASTSPPPS